MHYPRSPRKIINYTQSELTPRRPFCSQEGSWLGMLRVQLSLWGLSAIQICLSFPWRFSFQLDQLLSTLPASLIGFIFSIACFLGRQFSLLARIENSYQYPPVYCLSQTKVQLLKNYDLLCAPCPMHRYYLCRRPLWVPAVRIKSVKLPCSSVEPEHHE